MGRSRPARATASAACVLLTALALPGVSAAADDTVVVTTTIQAAVDAADPGDTVLVPAGTYRESVTVTTPGLTIRGPAGAVLDGPAWDSRTASGSVRSTGAGSRASPSRA